MKVSALIAAGVATLATAAPIRIVIVSKIPIHAGVGPDMGVDMGKFSELDAALSAIRVGHAGHHAENVEGPIRKIHFLPPPPPPGMRFEDESLAQRIGRPSRHGGCKGKMNTKFIEISERLRKAFGMPSLFSGDHPRHGDVHMSPPFRAVASARPVAPEFHILPHFAGGVRPDFYYADGRRSTDEKFYHRLGRAMLQLSPWEGRAMAFVLGCGIGVLLRMFFMFTLLIVRGRRARRIQLPTEEPAAPIVVFAVPPTYIVDEKDPSTFPPEYFTDNKPAVVENVVQETPRA